MLMHTSTTPTATAAASVRAERAVVPPPPVLLSLAEVDVIQTAARRQCKTQVRQTQVLNGPIRWRLLADENELKICKGRLRTQPSTTVEPPFYLSVVEVAATLDEVIDVFRTDTTQHAKAYTRRFAKDVVGATTLATLTTPGLIDQPLSETHIVVSWVARKQHPASWLRHNQDMCLIEASQLVKIDGSPGWVHSAQAVDYREYEWCPRPTKAYRRVSHFLEGYVVKASSRPGHMLVSYMVLDCLRLPAWYMDMAMKRRCRKLMSLDHYLRENRLHATPFLNLPQLVPKARRRQCFLCQKSFNFWSSKGNCTKCGEVVCSRCSALWQVQVSSFPSFMRVCSTCALGSRRSDRGFPVPRRNSLDELHASGRRDEETTWRKSGGRPSTKSPFPLPSPREFDIDPADDDVNEEAARPRTSSLSRRKTTNKTTLHETCPSHLLHVRTTPESSWHPSTVRLSSAATSISLDPRKPTRETRGDDLVLGWTT
ncbi:unnamed protein product [Aphanomyces euteiches]|uniref:FYVE-type domain-containing protein n=1 Tax=Aphanomyces euteiches TaxID=100861 RepID=A0A6G0X816_9STRA|nr:hypothetical protein Ae201684_007193 [Aphanomyces euteiches]KAH9100886.1 hypothetical protein Ae201684P_007077 [Aphanomyces euteiches]KAH9153613.1 hypothetical protein AeRB84_004166 [Aphanomyces euteiches]